MKEDGTIIILLDRLIENSLTDFRHGFYWDGEYVTFNDIDNAIRNGIKGTDEPYGDTWKHPAKKHNKLYHINRVVYFVNHPEEIKDIELDNACDGRYILPYVIIVDGWHRVMAAKYLNLNEIEAKYGGRMDILDYLIGKRKTMPLESI